MRRLLDVICRARVDMKNGSRRVVTEWVYVVRGQEGSEIEDQQQLSTNISEIHQDVQ